MLSRNKQFSQINVIFIVLGFFVFSGLFVVSVTASEQSFSKVCLPVLDIKIDGKAQDWLTTIPQLKDIPGDSNVFTHTGIDILSCSLAINQRRDTLFVMVKVIGGPNFEYNLVQYMMEFDDPAVNSTNRESFEWLTGIDSYNKFWIWDLRGGNRDKDQTNLTTWASSENKISKYAQDDVVEYSMPFSLFQGMEEFKFQLFLKLKDRDKTQTDQVSSKTIFIRKVCIKRYYLNS